MLIAKANEMGEASDGSRLQITMVCARFPPFVGGTETHVAEVSRRLVERGHGVTVATTVLDRHRVGTTEEHGVQIVRVLAGPRTSDLHMAPQIYDLIRDAESDIVHIQGYHTLVAPIAMASAIAADQPFVVTFHSGGHSSRLRRLVRPVQHRVLRCQFRHARQLVGVSEFETKMFRDILRLPDSMYRTIANGASEEFLNVPLPSRPQSPPVVMTVGRLEPYKRHDIAIAAIARVRHLVPDVRLLVVGNGPDLDHLRRVASHHDVDDIVEFRSMPYSDRMGMATTMAGASVVTLMSSYESQGIVGLESLAVGCRLVVTAGSALDELASYDGVTVVPGTDVADVADAVVRQLESPATGRQPVPTWVDTTNAVEHMYREVLVAR